ncbi:Lipid transfer protein [Medicago truncatula]|uniref:Lipid transfer protein n=1 Tax=Medicago truncatula TaxID=3880 RepID=G7JK58_MEDTR|nr:Lipid transfer protein [Medicago truncatula]
MASLRIITFVSLMVLLMINTTEAQSTDIPSCATNLIPCADYLNSTKPPSSCCDPIKKTVETELTCLCNLFYAPGLLATFNINTTQALALSRNCGVTTDLTTCKHNGSAPAPTSGGSPPGKKFLHILLNLIFTSCIHTLHQS